MIQDEASCTSLLQFMATHVTCGDGRQTRSVTPTSRERYVMIQVRCLSCGAFFADQINLPDLMHALRAETLPRLTVDLVLAVLRSTAV